MALILVKTHISSTLLLPLLLLLLAAAFVGQSHGLSPLSTEDNFTIGFYNETNPTISFVSSADDVISNLTEGTEEETNRGGFRLFFHGEEGTAPLDTNLLANGNLTTSSQGWEGSYTYVENGGRDGKGAICLTSEKIAFQRHSFSELDEEPFGIRVSGWSKADGVSGLEDSDYSLYLEVTYSDDTVAKDIAATFSVGTHDYEFAERYYELTKPAKSFCLYLVLRNNHTEGMVWFDDVSVQVYTIKSISVGNITKIAENVYQQVSTVQEAKLVANFTAKKSYFKIRGTLENLNRTKDVRAVTLSFGIPIDTSKSTWYWGSEFSSKKVGKYIHAQGSRQVTVPGLDYAIDTVPVAGMSDQNLGVGIGIRPGAVTAYRLSFNGCTSQLMLSMDFALTGRNMIPRSAWFEFVLFKLDAPASASASAGEIFRSALDKYSRKIFGMYYTERVAPKQGIWMPFDAVEKVEGWKDFGFAFYAGSAPLLGNAKSGVGCYLSVGEPYVRVDVNANTSEELLAAVGKCKASECKMASSSHLVGPNGEMVYYAEEDGGDEGARLKTVPLNINPKTSAGNDKIQQVKTLYDSALAVSNATVSGIFVGGVDEYSAVLDYQQGKLKNLGVPPLYDSDLVPCTLSGSWTLDFLRELARKLRTEHDADAMIMGSAVYAQFPHASRYVDVAGLETDWAPNGVYTPLGHEALLYYRANAYHRPYLLLQKTNFSAWTREMTEKYMQAALLYGLWPGFAYSEEDNTTYFADESAYERDRDLFKRYVPALETITEKRWEPVTCASVAAEDGSVGYVERWGGSVAFPMYLTVRVESPELLPRNATLAVTVDLGCLSVVSWEKDEVNVTEIVQTDSPVDNVSGDSGRMTFTFNFETNRTYLFEILGNIKVQHDDDEFIYDEYGSEEFESASASLLASRVAVFALAALAYLVALLF